jgi:hypothetical protein
MAVFSICCWCSGEQIMMVWFGLIGIVASIRCCNIVLPAMGWSDLGRDDLIRDPSPAAKITTDTFILFNN